MRKQPVLRLVHNAFHMAHRQIELFRKWFIADPIQEPSFQNCSISLIVDVLVNQVRHLRIAILYHFLTFTRPSPPQLEHFL